MKDNKYVLAMYDIRGKQDFIFRTNKLQEIVGASWLIRDCFEDYLFPAADSVAEALPEGNKKGIFSYKNADKEENEFSAETFKKHMEEGYIGEVVYDGGGNFLLLFQSEAIFQDVTYAFTKSLVKAIGGLRVLGTCVEIDGFEDYKADQKKLYERHARNKTQESTIAPWACPPFVQVDRKTSQPLIEMKNADLQMDGAVKGKLNALGKMTKEAYMKRLKYYQEVSCLEKEGMQSKLTKAEKEYYKEIMAPARDYYRDNTNILDDLIEEKGVDSQLAVVYIDGNGMGAKVQGIIGEKKTYEECVNALRRFSEDIQRIYVDEGVNHALKSLRQEYRIVVSAGDEINFIVKAKDALQCAKSYLDALQKYNQEQSRSNAASACAGIAVFHSHAPYAEAYRIAEECCETGKKLMKKENIPCASFLDFHICQGAIGTSLKDIRKEENAQGNEMIISRPWLIWKEDGMRSYPASGDVSLMEFGDLWKEGYQPAISDGEKMSISDVCRILRKFGRSNVKGLAQAAKSSEVDLEMELRRMWAHASETIKEEITEDNWKNLLSMSGIRKRKMIYDIAISYDLWFAEEMEREG